MQLATHLGPGVVGGGVPSGPTLPSIVPKRAWGADGQLLELRAHPRASSGEMNKIKHSADLRPMSCSGE